MLGIIYARLQFVSNLMLRYTAKLSSLVICEFVQVRKISLVEFF